MDTFHLNYTRFNWNDDTKLVFRYKKITKITSFVHVLNYALPTSYLLSKQQVELL